MKLLIATGNAGKLREFDRILNPLGFEVEGQCERFPNLHADESGATFAENARIKAWALHGVADGAAVIADDSGLCVDALDGAPGVHSARYGGERLSYPEKIQKLLEELEAVPRAQRTARFVACICYIDGQGQETMLVETCEGWIGFAPRGAHGFGFDPIFMVGEQSFSELDAIQKDACSHRGKALRALVAHLNGR